MVIFNTLPGTTRVPGTYVEVDPNRSQQSPRIQPYRLLVIGQRLSTGTAAALTLQEVRTASSARALFGRGSQLAQMLERALAVTKSVPVFAVGVADPAGVAATGKITYTGPATGAGEIALYIGGRRVEATVASGDTATTVAAAVAAAVNADLDMPVTATASVGVVTLLARHLGTMGNLIDTRHSYQFGEKLPAGVGATILAIGDGTGGTVTGTGNVALSAVWAVIGDEWFNLAAIGVTDATNLSSVETEFLDRFGPIRQIDAHAITALNASVATVAALGLTRNSKHVSILGVGLSPTPAWEISAQAAGQVAVAAQADPARPFETLLLPDVLAPERSARLTFANQQQLLESGISTASVDEVGAVRLLRVITTYRVDENGVEDEAFLDLTTLLTDSFIRWDFRTTCRTKFNRFKIGEDNVRYAAGQPILTPSTGRAEAMAKAREWQERGLIEDLDQFEADLVVERNSQDASRMDFFLPTNLMNGLVVIGVRLSFIL